MDVMIFKDDDGYFRILSEIGLDKTKFLTYEDAVMSLPEKLRDGLI